MTELVSHSIPLLTASVPKRVGLRFELAEHLPCIEADPSRIDQILMSLVINASEAIRPGSDGLIQISTGSCEVTPEVARLHSLDRDVAAGPYVYLTVRDNGSGMDAATLAHIFDPFFTTKFIGRGLGLAAVHGTVRTLNGFIDVDSSPGVGSTFRVNVPASDKKLATEQPMSTPQEQPRGASTILVVDDEEMVRKLASATLRRYGYEVLEAENGKEALHVLAGSPTLPSAVLLDLAMPVMGGDELVPILAARYPDLKVVVSSGYPEEETRTAFPSGSIAGVVQKPYTGTVLAEKIAQVLHPQSEGR